MQKIKGTSEIVSYVRIKEVHKRNNADGFILESDAAICGNSVIEKDEQCDCGDESVIINLLPIQLITFKEVSERWRYLLYSSR